MTMACSVEAQLKIIAVIETIVSAFFLGLNLKILIQLLIDPSNPGRTELKPDLSESALVFYFLIRVIYLIGEVLLAVYLTYNVFKRNVNGLVIWIFMTIIFSIPSRCYFIGGILWGKYFLLTVVIFSANLAFTAYSLIILCVHVKRLTASRPGSAGPPESGDTYMDFL